MRPRASGRVLALLPALVFAMCTPDRAHADDPPVEDAEAPHLRITLLPDAGAPGSEPSASSAAGSDSETVDQGEPTSSLPPAWAPDPRCDANACAELGHCTVANGGCVAGRAEDCEQATVCHEDGACFFDREEARCSDGMVLESPATLAAGIAFTALGGVLVPTGVFVARSADPCTADSCSAEQRSDASAAIDLGNGLAFGGALSVIVGVAALIAGSHEVLKSERFAAAPTLSVGPGGGTLVWAF